MKSKDKSLINDKIKTDIICKIKNGSNLIDICDEHKITPNDIKRLVRNDEDFAESYRDAMSMYAQRKIDSIERLSKQANECTKRTDLTKLKAAELQLTCLTKSLAYIFPERYKEKSNELFINLPEYGKATSPKERLSILAKAVCDKRISVDAAEKLARMCEIELKITDFAVFSESVSDRIERLENIIVKANGLIPQSSSKVTKEAQY